MALEARTKSRLAHFMGCWALLWGDSGLWYPLDSELEDLPGFLSSDAKRSEPRGWKRLGGCCVLLLPGPAVPHVALGWLGLLPAATVPVIKPRAVPVLP